MLEWMLIGVGFTGAFTLVHLYRAAIRKLGWIPSVESYFSPKGGCAEAVETAIQLRLTRNASPARCGRRVEKRSNLIFMRVFRPCCRNPGR